MRVAEQLALDPKIVSLLKETGSGDNILKTEGFDGVFDTMYATAQADSENIIAAWIGDVDANCVTQSDGFTSGEDYEITERVWYYCMEEGKTILTEPYVDSSTGKMILSAVAPVYDENGNALGVAGLDILLTHVSTVMEEYKIGYTGYVSLFSSNGIILYDPDQNIIQKNVSEISISADTAVSASYRTVVSASVYQPVNS